jgi:hypothetical protein
MQESPRPAWGQGKEPYRSPCAEDLADYLSELAPPLEHIYGSRGFRPATAATTVSRFLNTRRRPGSNPAQCRMADRTTRAPTIFRLFAKRLPPNLSEGGEPILRSYRMTARRPRSNLLHSRRAIPSPFRNLLERFTNGALLLSLAVHAGSARHPACWTSSIGGGAPPPSFCPNGPASPVRSVHVDDPVG